MFADLCARITCTNRQLSLMGSSRDILPMEEMPMGMVRMTLAKASTRSARWEELRAALAPVAEIDAHVGGRLRARREALGISQGRLGQSLGITFSQVQKYEKGANRIGAGRLFYLAELLGVPVQYFFEGLSEAGTGPVRNDAGTAAEAERLQEAFSRISDPHAREALLSLAASMVENE